MKTIIEEYVEQRNEVIEYVKARMIEQKVDWSVAIQETTCINFFPSRDVQNLYKCIKSDLPEHVIKAIVAHDFNGLSENKEHFLPKSRQFEEQK